MKPHETIKEVNRTLEESVDHSRGSRPAVS